jgi:ABC-type multidrug transport system ATPase subunit
MLFEDVTMTIERGEIVLLRGKSGCGKTSFLYLLNSFLDPVRGEIRLDGRKYKDLRYEELRRRVVYLHQTPVMETGLPVIETLMAPFSFRENRSRQPPAREKLDPLLDELHLRGELLERDSGSLSVGEQQRVAILRASLLEPEFLLLDEPLANLDRESAGAIQEWIARRSRARTGLVVVSHQPAGGLSGVGTRRMEISGGKVREHRH